MTLPPTAVADQPRVVERCRFAICSGASVPYLGVRSHFRLRNSGTDSISKSDMKWINGSDNAAEP